LTLYPGTVDEEKECCIGDLPADTTGLVECPPARRRRLLEVEGTADSAADLINQTTMSRTWCFTPPARNGSLFDDIIGRSVVIHKNDGGARWFCGNIVLVDTTPPEVENNIEMTLSLTYLTELSSDEVETEESNIQAGIVNGTSFTNEQVEVGITKDETRRRLLEFKYSALVTMKGASKEQLANIGTLSASVYDAVVSSTNATAEVTSEPECSNCVDEASSSTGGDEPTAADVDSAVMSAPRLFFISALFLILRL
jgi:hypothetical protein